jgi:tetratricopeptide (TPR) repeat protein
MFWSLHDYENAMATAKKCLKIIEESDRTQFSYDTSALQAGCQNIVGLSADDIGDGNTARQYYELSARTIETIPKGERDMLVIKAYATAKNNIGWFEQNAGHYETARSFHQEAIDVYKKPLACDPENEAVRNKYASYLRGLGKTHRLKENYEEALMIYKEAYSLYDKMDWNEAPLQSLGEFESLLVDITTTIASISG